MFSKSNSSCFLTGNLLFAMSKSHSLICFSPSIPNTGSGPLASIVSHLFPLSRSSIVVLGMWYSQTCISNSLPFFSDIIESFLQGFFSLLHRLFLFCLLSLNYLSGTLKSKKRNLKLFIVFMTNFVLNWKIIIFSFQQIRFNHMVVF